MQYILTQEEYDALKSAQVTSLKLSKQKLQKLCTKIADTMPVVWGWGENDPRPWGCIHSEEDEWHCDQCPVKDICPETCKSWSK